MAASFPPSRICSLRQRPWAWEPFSPPSASCGRPRSSNSSISRDHIGLEAMVHMGYPDEKLGRPRRLPLEQVAHLNSWERLWSPSLTVLTLWDSARLSERQTHAGRQDVWSGFHRHGLPGVGDNVAAKSLALSSVSVCAECRLRLLPPVTSGAGVPSPALKPGSKGGFSYCKRQLCFHLGVLAEQRPAHSANSQRL